MKISSKLFSGFFIIAIFSGINGYVGFLGTNDIIELDDPEKLEDEINKTLGTIVLLSSISVLLAIGIGFLISSSIGIPLKKLESSAKEVAQGNLDAKILHKQNDEIGEFSNTFNSMLDSLKKIIDLEKDLAEEKLKKGRLAAIGELASRLSHDLRNPLSTIKTTSAIIKLKTGKDGDSKYTKNLDLIDDAVDRMSYQIESVLDFIRIKPLQIRENSIYNIIKKTIDTIKIPQNIRISTELTDAKIYCNSQRLAIVFTNLITNSIQAIGENSGEITTRFKEKDGQIACSVIDSGPGIPKDKIKKIFEPLFTTKQTGTGLGLSSCANIVQEHNGKISVRNNPTTFTITLPKRQQKSLQLNDLVVKR